MEASPRGKASPLIGATAVMAAASCYEGAAVHVSAWLFRAALAYALWLLWPEARGRRSGARRYSAWALAATGLGAAGWGLVRSPAFFSGVEGAIALSFATLLFCTLLRQPAAVQRRALAVAAVVAGGHGAWALGQRMLALQPRGHGGFFNPNDLAAMAAPAAVLAALAALDARRKPWRAAGAWAVCVACTAGVVASGSRSGALGLGLGLLLALALAPDARGREGQRTAAAQARAQLACHAGRRRRRLQLGAFGAVAVGLATVLLVRGRADLADPYAYSRLAIWRSAWLLLCSTPLGHGFGGAAQALAQRGVEVVGPVRFPAIASHAHSEWLQAGLELGVLGLLATALPPLYLATTLARGGGWGRPQLGVLVSFVLPALNGATLHQPPIAAFASAWAAYAWPQAGGAEAGSLPPAAAAAVTQAGEQQGSAQGSTPVGACGSARARTGRQARTGGVSRKLPLALGLGALMLCSLPSAVAQGLASAGRVAWTRGEPQLALMRLQRACMAAPWQVGHLLNRADVVRHLGEEGEAAAEALYTDVAAMFPQRFEPWQRLAELREAALQKQAGGSTAAAAAGWTAVAEAYVEAAKRQPKLALLWTQAATAFYRGGALASAEELYGRALEHEPNCAQALLGLAQLAQTRGDAAAVRGLAQRALEAHRLRTGQPAYPKAVLSLSDEALQQARRFAGAEAP